MFLTSGNKSLHVYSQWRGIVTTRAEKPAALLGSEPQINTHSQIDSEADLHIQQFINEHLAPLCAPIFSLCGKEVYSQKAQVCHP